VDGCGAWRTLTFIVLPLALPGLAVSGLLVWLLSREEFILATCLTLGAKTMPLQIYDYLYQGNWFDTAVAATLMTLPVLVLSALLQRYLREMNLAGAMREDRVGGKGSHSRFPARGRLLARDLCTHLASFGSSGVATDC
jgi:ABC-type glycerol-3-phosphate transport system permease component